MKKSAAASPKRTVIVDAGPLKAAIDRGDVDHAWAVRVFRAVSARYITFGAAIATALIQPVFNEVEQWAPRMDFADACAVVLAALESGRRFRHSKNAGGRQGIDSSRCADHDRDRDETMYSVGSFLDRRGVDAHV